MDSISGASVQELSRYMFLAGGLVFLLLGAAHVGHCPQQPGDRKGLSPADPGLAEWFRAPIIAVGLALLLFSRAWVLGQVGGQ